jgi:methyl-accepting chemotaxis protein
MKAISRGIRAKLLTGFGAVLLLTVALSLVGLVSLNMVNTESARSYEEHLVPIRDLAQVRASLGDVDSQILRTIVDQSAQNRAAYTAAAERDAAEIDRLVGANQSSLTSDDERRAYVAFQADWRTYLDGARAALRQASAGDSAGATRTYFDQLLPAFGKVDADVGQIIAAEDRDAQQTDAEIDAAFIRGLWLTVGLLILALAIGATIANRLSRDIAGAATEVAAAARGLARGNTQQQLNVHSNDELGVMAEAFRDTVAYQEAMARAAEAIAAGDLTREVRPQSGEDVLGTAFQRMTANLRDLVSEMQRGSQSLSAAGTEILAAVSQQSAGATEQAAAITQTTATVDEVKASADQALQTADAARETALQAARSAADGVEAVREATAGMAELQRRVQSIAEQILALSEQSQQIGEIITTVGDLADQSNLLALNAAIEASRAGEQGKGFAVVAQEIRSLAEQSKGATAQVRTILSDIQRATNAAVMATEQGTKGAEASAATVERAGAAIDELAGVVHTAAQTAAQIAAAVRQHSVGMEQIAGAMTNIDQATRQSLAATRDTRLAAENLTQVALRLDQLVAPYRA